MNILDLKESCEKAIIDSLEKIEIIDFQPNLGYNAKAVVRFFIEEKHVADITGGEHVGWEYDDIYGDYFEEVIDILRVRHWNKEVKQ